MLAIYNAGAALFRAQGNSRISMLIAGLINIVNITGNSIMIFGLKWGVAGAATSSVLSRGTAAVVITILLLNPERCAAAAGSARTAALSDASCKSACRTDWKTACFSSAAYWS